MVIRAVRGCWIYGPGYDVYWGVGCVGRYRSWFWIALCAFSYITGNVDAYLAAASFHAFWWLFTCLESCDGPLVWPLRPRVWEVRRVIWGWDVLFELREFLRVLRMVYVCEWDLCWIFRVPCIHVWMDSLFIRRLSGNFIFPFWVQLSVSVKGCEEA